DRFRLELTKNSLAAYVNGHLYFQDSGWDAVHQLPDSMVNGGQVYTYFSDWQDAPSAPAYRFHWGHLAINPHAADGKTIKPPSAAPSFCLGMPQNTCGMSASMAPTPTSTPPAGVATATSTPARTATPAPATPTRTATPAPATPT